MAVLPPYGLTQTVAPAEALFSVDEVKTFCRAPGHNDENTLLSSFVSAATDFFETKTNRALVQATYFMVLDFFPGRTVDEWRPPGWRYGVLNIPRSPLSSITSLQYVDTDGVLQTLASTEYQVSKRREPGRIAPARFKVWPVTDPFTMEAVQITFVAGYATASAVPERYKQCVRWLVNHLYENREVAIEVALQQVPVALDSYMRSCSLGVYT